MATPSKTPATSTPKTANLTPNAGRKVASPRPVTAGKQPYKSPMAAMKTPASAHSHNLSTSSQPSNTPLLAHTFTEGAVNLESPKVDKVQRLQDVASLLKTRIVGRGVTREGVVRVAQSSGFTTYWDEDLLTVAGNCVDLEIMFDGGHKDTVKDVVLKISASDSDERQEEASEILKKDLAQMPDGVSRDPWNMLDGFAKNIGRLRQLDKLSETVNCFEAVDGIYDAFKQVWDQEKKRLKWRSELHHICAGSVGRARMNKRRKLGVAVDYWVPRHENADGAGHGEYTEEITSNVAGGAEDSTESQNMCWSAQISCEAGFPSLRVSRDWLVSDILTSDDSEETQVNGPRPLRPAWKAYDLSGEVASASKDDSDPMKIDGESASGLIVNNAHFTFTLDPQLYLPLEVVDSLVGRSLILNTDRSKVMRYNQVLDPENCPRWLKSVATYDANGLQESRTHSYQLSAHDLECYPISTAGFAHPSQLSVLLPVFRQYACLWSVLQRLVDNPIAIGEIAQSEDLLYKPGRKIKANTVKVRSNVKYPIPQKGLSTKASEALKIDITLSFTDTLSLMKPRLEVYAPLRDNRSSSKQGSFCYAAVEIGENGELKVLATQIAGMNSERTTHSASRVLAMSEDIGVLVEWMLSQYRKTSQLGHSPDPGT